MAAGEADPTSLWQEAAFAPTCRACLRIVDGWLPATDAPAGLPLLAAVVAEQVVENSSTYVTGIPGQHLETTRRAIRKALRSRGLRSNTHVEGDALAVWSDDAYEALDQDQMSTRVAAALERIMAGGDESRPADADASARSVNWNTWVVDT